jgi:hypothetical protein
MKSTSTTRSSVITLKRLYNPSRLLVSSRSFYHSAPALWNILPKEFRRTNSTHSKSQSLLFQLSPSQFHKKLKTHLFAASFPIYLTLPPTWTTTLPVTLALCLSFTVIFICHSPSPHSLLLILWTNLLYSVAK